MIRVRRLYVYGVCAVSLLLFATGIENLTRLLIQTLAQTDATPWLWLSRGDLRHQVSFFVALTVIDGPVWIGHWLFANRISANQATDLAERGSEIRRFYLFLVMAGALVFFIPGMIGLIRIPLWAMLGATLNQPFVSALGAPIGLVVVTVPIWLYHYRIARSDAAVTGEAGGLGTIRRLYFYAAAAVTVNFLLVNDARLGTSIWEGLTSIFGPATSGGTNWTRAALPSYAAAVFVFLAVWWWHLGWTEAKAAGTDELAHTERRSLLRRVYLYGIVLISIVVLLVNASTLLNNSLRSAFGAADPTGTGRSLLAASGQPLVWATIYGAFWLYHRWWLQREGQRVGEVAEQASLRRFYYYLIAAVGLTVFAIGTILLLNTVLSLLTTAPSQNGPDWLRDRVSLSATLTVLGGLVWLGHWQYQQRLATGTEAAIERTALWRRLYLYLAIFVTVVAILIDAASLLYQLLLVGLGERVTPTVLDVIRTPLSVSIVTGILLLYHWRVLRSDLAVESSPKPRPSMHEAAVLVRCSDPTSAETVLAQIADLMPRQADISVIRGPRLERKIRDQLERWHASKTGIN